MVALFVLNCSNSKWLLDLLFVLNRLNLMMLLSCGFLEVLYRATCLFEIQTT